MATAKMVFCLMAIVAVGWIQTVVGQDCSQTEITVAAVEECVNAVRANPGRYAADMCGADAPTGSLYSDSSLTSAAQTHNGNMAAQGFFGHGNWDGRIRSAGFSGGEIGENLANGYNSAYAVVAGWMCSPGHRRNLVNCNYDSLGTAVDCVNGMSGGCLVTQTYGCSTGNCCGGSGRSGPDATGSGGSPALGGLQTGLFGGGLFSNFLQPSAPPPPSQGGFLSNIFGGSGAEVQGDFDERPASAPAPAPATNDCGFRIMCRLFSG